MSALLNIISTIFNWINALLKKRKQDHLQDEYDEIEKSPADWFGDHFPTNSSVRNESADKDKTAKTKPSDSKAK